MNTEPSSRKALLEVDGVNLSFGAHHVLTDVGFVVPERTIASVIGPNGAGKTSLFNSVTGFYRPQRGRVTFDGKPLLGIKPHKVTAMGIARTFQNVRLFKEMSVMENLMSGMHCRTRSNALDAILATPRYQREEREVQRVCEACLTFVGLTEARDRLSSNLPYGHQRLVEIARAMASQPKLILLDEPAAGLTSLEKENLMTLIRRLRDEQGISVLLIEHDMGLVMQVSEQITVLDHGKIIARGDAQAIQNDPQVIEAYLGQEETELEAS